MDTLESALVVSAELGNQKNAEYLQSLIGVEKSLQDNPIFKEANKLALQIKDTFTSYNESPAMKELMEMSVVEAHIARKKEQMYLIQNIKISG